jgi:hypothetical protein
LRGTQRAIEIVERRLGLTERQRVDPKSGCRQVASYYAQMVRAMDALGREYGFPTLMLKTPTLLESRKPRTTWEASLEARPGGMRELTTLCGAAIDSVMASRRGKTYFSLDSLFDQETRNVFIDDYGHVTEDANGVIAERIVDLLAPLLRRAGSE